MVKKKKEPEKREPLQSRSWRGSEQDFERQQFLAERWGCNANEAIRRVLWLGEMLERDGVTLKNLLSDP